MSWKEETINRYNFEDVDHLELSIYQEYDDEMTGELFPIWRSSCQDCLQVIDDNIDGKNCTDQSCTLFMTCDEP